MLFIGTFFICLFIFMMQFLWRYVDELVGKGLEMSVLAQFFFYSALTLIPLTQYRALPEPVLAGRQEKGAPAPFSVLQDYP